MDVSILLSLDDQSIFSRGIRMYMYMYMYQWCDTSYLQQRGLGQQSRAGSEREQRGTKSSSGREARAGTKQQERARLEVGQVSMVAYVLYTSLRARLLTVCLHSLSFGIYIYIYINRANSSLHMCWYQIDCIYVLGASKSSADDAPIFELCSGRHRTNVCTSLIRTVLLRLIAYCTLSHNKS